MNNGGGKVRRESVYNVDVDGQDISLQSKGPWVMFISMTLARRSNFRRM
jgi:hypothetical protein